MEAQWFGGWCGPVFVHVCVLGDLECGVVGGPECVELELGKKLCVVEGWFGVVRDG